MSTSSQFTKIGIPLIVVSFLVAVAIILAIVLSKGVEEPTTKGKFISSRGRDLVWQDFCGSTKRICPLFQAKTMPIRQPLIMQLSRGENSKDLRTCSRAPHLNQRNLFPRRSPLHGPFLPLNLACDTLFSGGVRSKPQDQQTFANRMWIKL